MPQALEEQDPTAVTTTNAAVTPEPEPAPPAAQATPPAPAAQAQEPDRSGTSFESLAVAGFIFGLFAMVIAVIAVGLAARAVNQNGGGGGGGGAAPVADAPATLDVTLGDFFIDPAEGTIAGDGTINLTNTGGVQHDLVIGEQQSEMLDPGAAATWELGGIEAGTYDWYCSVPGHREAGMEGTVTVG